MRDRGRCLSLVGVACYNFAMSTDLQPAVLDRILDPVGRCFTPEVAAQLVALRADPEAQARIDELADKNTAGTMTSEELAAYETYVRAIEIVAVLQAKARAMLADNGHDG
jgi:hypothetical protein